MFLGGCVEDVEGPPVRHDAPSSSSASSVWPQSVKDMKQDLKRQAQGGHESDDKHQRRCEDQDCPRCKWIRNGDKCQRRLPLVQPSWGLDMSRVPAKLANDSWLEEAKDDDGSWLGVGCIACARFRIGPEADAAVATSSPSKRDAARAFANYHVNTTDAVQMSNLNRHHEMAGHKEACLRFIGIDPSVDELRGAPSPEDYGLRCAYRRTRSIVRCGGRG